MIFLGLWFFMVLIVSVMPVSGPEDRPPGRQDCTLRTLWADIHIIVQVFYKENKQQECIL